MPRPLLSHPLFTEVPGIRILGSLHSPGPRPMGVAGSDRLPSAIIRTSPYYPWGVLYRTADRTGAMCAPASLQPLYGLKICHTVQARYWQDFHNTQQV
jgi:hypothetical protein